jgi:hypothetical protein
MDFLKMKTFLFFFVLSINCHASDEWFYPKVYKGVIFACISEKATDAEMDELQLTDAQLKNPEIKFIGCKIEKKETETYDER